MDAGEEVGDVSSAELVAVAEVEEEGEVESEGLEALEEVGEEEKEGDILEVILVPEVGADRVGFAVIIVEEGEAELGEEELLVVFVADDDLVAE